MIEPVVVMAHVNFLQQKHEIQLNLKVMVLPAPMDWKAQRLGQLCFRKASKANQG
jgi:hypothetical protein